AQSVLYGYDEDGVRHAELILERADNGLSEREIILRLTTNEPKAPSNLSPVPLSAGQKGGGRKEESH
ncbi:MAG: hypothetical protein MK042_06535, partial [Cognatishimia sp.]|nr:hypothetical protein [Cognatishimia sp.]